MKMNAYQEGTQATAKQFKPTRMTAKTRHQLHLLLSTATANTEIAGQVKKNVFHQHEDYISDSYFLTLKDFVEGVNNRRVDVFVGELPLSPASMSLLEGTLGIVDESGEVAELVDRHIIQGKPVENFKELLKKELGDVMWYMAETAKAADLTLQEIAEANVAKLEKRYPGGFTVDASVNREEEERIKDDSNVALLEEVKNVFDEIFVDDEGKIILKASELKIDMLQTVYNKLTAKLVEGK